MKTSLEERIDALSHYVEGVTKNEDTAFRERAKLFLIDPGRLDEEVQSAAALESYFGSLYAKAQEKEAKAYLKKKEVRAKVLLATRERCRDDGAKVTIPEIEALVESSSAVIATELDHIKAQVVSNEIDATLKAARRKSRMLELQRQNLEREQKLRSGI